MSFWHCLADVSVSFVVFFQSCHKMLASLTVATAAQCMHSDRGVYHFQDFEGRCVAFFLYGKSESQTSLALLAKQIWRH